MRKLVYIALLCLLGINTQGQDPQYTQFYATSTYLNPAFAGTSIQHRLGAAYRNQWPGIPGSFKSYAFSYDRYAPYINSGFGFLATNDYAGAGALGNTTLAAQYAYEARITRSWFFRPALQFSYTNRSIDFDGLFFTDQQIRNNDPTSLEENTGNPVNYFDVGAGFLVMNKQLWLGAAVHHLTEPQESIYGDVNARIPRKIGVHGGYRFKFENQFARQKSSLVAAFSYKQQGDFNQLDLGAYYEINPIVMGIWYRGLPAKSNGYGRANHDAMTVLVGWYDGPYKVGYSYDITISQLGIGQSGGSHEITITYEWANRRNKKLAKRRIIPCAKF